MSNNYKLNLSDSSLSLDDESSTRIIRKSSKKKKTTKIQKVVMLIGDTKYKVIKHVGKKTLGFTLLKEGDDWDICWTDTAVTPEMVSRMKSYQKINHLPGMYTLSRKNYLGRNLMKMKKQFPTDYDFFPPTFILPTDYNEMVKMFNGKKKTFILKPEASCQGRGIIMIRSQDEIPIGERYVAQRYIHKPYLIDELKFDLRIFVLITSSSPMRIYIFKEGLARFATDTYKPPTKANIGNHYIHLTNYAVNKKNPNFEFNQEEEKANKGHKRSLDSVWKDLKDNGIDPDLVWKKIKEMIVKSFCSVQPILEHTYKACQPNNYESNMCFELLGLDILLDHRGKPYLLEVNHTPSFGTDTPFDWKVKHDVVKNSLQLMGITGQNRQDCLKQERKSFKDRISRRSYVRVPEEERQRLIEKGVNERIRLENEFMGDFERIYPSDDPELNEKYSDFISYSNKVYLETTTRTISKAAEIKPQDLPKRPTSSKPSLKVLPKRNSVNEPPTFTSTNKSSATNNGLKFRIIHKTKERENYTSTKFLPSESHLKSEEINYEDKTNEGKSSIRNFLPWKVPEKPFADYSSRKKAFIDTKSLSQITYPLALSYINNIDSKVNTFSSRKTSAKQIPKHYRRPQINYNVGILDKQLKFSAGIKERKGSNGNFVRPKIFEFNLGVLSPEEMEDEYEEEEE